MYLLDSNTYIQAKNLYYQMSFCPAYWSWLDLQYEQSDLTSISSVYEELIDFGDDLSEWAKDRKDRFIDISNEDIQNKFVDVVDYVNNLQHKTQPHKTSFLAKADPWLIAAASVTGATIVTEEIWTAPNSTKVKIPNICDHFNVQYIKTHEMLNNLNARFVLE